MLDLVNVTQNTGVANKTQAARALIAQAYATSVIRQPKVDFSDDPRLKKHEDTINEGLTTAQKHARNYLDNIQPEIIKNIASISNCYHLLSELATTLPEGSTKEEWLESLRAIKKNFEDHKNQAQTVVELVGKLNTELTEDSLVFSSSINSLNAAVEGNDGIFNLNKQLIKNIEDAIDTNIAKIVVGIIGMVGGSILVAVGALASFVTGGAAAGVIVGGVIIAGGSGFMFVTSAIDIKKLQDLKAELIADEKKIIPEVGLALGINSGYQGFVRKISNVQVAVTGMIGAWKSLVSHLDEVISDLENGISTVDKVREMYLAGAKEEIKSLLTNIDIIKEQMAGVDAAIVIAPQGESVGEAAVDAAKKAA